MFYTSLMLCLVSVLALCLGLASLGASYSTYQRTNALRQELARLMRPYA